ncbi:MAG: hypothetical protein NTV51_21910 [Verrucomicrobia bacterium]|nr:hypothetical protein [Verrucomicrobiota bacterium]
MKLTPPGFRPVLAALAGLGVFALFSAHAADTPAPRWFKGNLHTHSLWSDGNDYPEMIADSYKQRGYHFLAMSDHNVLEEGVKWFELKAPTVVKGEVVQKGGGAVLEKYLARFGPAWVEQRETGGKKEVRLKPLAEYRTLLEESGRFLMIPSMEVTSNWKRPKTATEPELGGPVHMNLTNPVAHVAPVAADNALEIMQKSVDAVLAQRTKSGQPMFLHLNHPNFVWGVTAEELMQVHHEKFFEVYNGHPGVHNDGDATRLSMDAMWDAILTRRLAELKLDVMYGIGVDDSHEYHQMLLGKSNPFRGWIMVRARFLTPEAIVNAMEAGDFYSSSGVTLADVRRTDRELAVEIQAEPGVTYVTQFIGTRRGYDPTSQLIPTPAGEAARKTLPHRRYSKDVGAVLAEVKGTKASYTLKGDELYVRAKIISSKIKSNPGVAGEVETAWTQPLVNPAK